MGEQTDTICPGFPTKFANKSHVGFLDTAQTGEPVQVERGPQKESDIFLANHNISKWTDSYTALKVIYTTRFIHPFILFHAVSI